VIALLRASPALAEEKKDESIPGFGLGVGVGLGNAYTGGTPATPPVSIYATFNLGESLRLEPNFGYWYIGKGASAATIITGGVEPNGGNAVQVGLGGFYVIRPVGPLGVYGGARIGMVFSGTSATLLDRTTVSASESSTPGASDSPPSSTSSWSGSRHRRCGTSSGWRRGSRPASTGSAGGRPSR
jgi:hypothetical protein